MLRGHWLHCSSVRVHPDVFAGGLRIVSSEQGHCSKFEHVFTCPQGGGGGGGRVGVLNVL